MINVLLVLMGYYYHNHYNYHHYYYYYYHSNLFQSRFHLLLYFLPPAVHSLSLRLRIGTVKVRECYNAFSLKITGRFHSRFI